MSIQNIKKWLNKLLVQDSRKVFKYFRLGASFFFTGMMAVYLANVYLPNSLAQELITLVGLIFVCFGFVLAIGSHIQLILVRVKKFFQNSA